MHFGPISKVSLAVALVLAAGGCRQSRPRAPSIGEAFVGPPNLKIRSDIPLQSSAVATVKHGDRLEILQRRRRFLRVRTPSGVEGWTDERELLNTEDMAYLRDLAQRAARMPVQGQATSYNELNVHTQPARGSPSFLQVKEKEKVDVLIHVVTPRADQPRKPLIPPAPKKAKAAPKKSDAKPLKYPLPPMPKPPPLPEDWLELSKTDRDEEPAPPEEPPEEKPTPTDDWSLVRTASGQSGWVLTRRLSMAIPDEVAQYAEGHRIVSYFSLGKVDDEDAKKDIWLWTTIGSAGPYDFDSFRVFIWSLRRHRYETAYIERNLKGYSPVLLQDVELSSGGKGKIPATAAKYGGFSVCTEKKDGQRYRREYALLGNIVRLAGESPCEAPMPVSDLIALKPPASPSAAQPETQQPSESFAQRARKRLKSLLHF